MKKTLGFTFVNKGRLSGDTPLLQSIGERFHIVHDHFSAPRVLRENLCMKKAFQESTPTFDWLQDCMKI